MEDAMIRRWRLYLQDILFAFCIFPFHSHFCFTYLPPFCFTGFGFPLGYFFIMSYHHHFIMLYGKCQMYIYYITYLLYTYEFFGSWFMVQCRQPHLPFAIVCLRCGGTLFETSPC
ncbi:hypothetical protein FPQ18DRAFT_319366, partial [Pyronema domesticum]